MRSDSFRDAADEEACLRRGRDEAMSELPSAIRSVVEPDLSHLSTMACLPPIHCQRKEKELRLHGWSLAVISMPVNWIEASVTKRRVRTEWLWHRWC